VRARHEGAKFDTDVFLVERGVLPATVAHAAHVKVTRVEPEIFIPPRPGQEVRRATGLRRDQALFFDGMERKVPIGLSRDGEPVFANLDFLDGSRGAHVNISGISGVATKTSYATFLLHSLFTSGALGGDAANTHALVFNVKGEDLLFLDQANARLKDEDRQAYAKMALPAESFGSVQILAPVRKGSAERLPATGSRGEGVRAFFWTIREVVEERLLRFLFAEADDTASQLSFVVDRIEAKSPPLRRRRERRRTPGSRSKGRGSRPSMSWCRRSRTTPTGTRAWPTDGRGPPLPAPWPLSSAGSMPRRSTSVTSYAGRTSASATLICSTGDGGR
jgi:DNA helicase HerA-like ATPase